jgi:hypothetical protein
VPKAAPRPALSDMIRIMKALLLRIARAVGSILVLLATACGAWAAFAYYSLLFSHDRDDFLMGTGLTAFALVTSWVGGMLIVGPVSPVRVWREIVDEFR